MSVTAAILTNPAVQHASAQALLAGQQLLQSPFVKEFTSMLQGALGEMGISNGRSVEFLPLDEQTEAMLAKQVTKFIAKKAIAALGSNDPHPEADERILLKVAKYERELDMLARVLQQRTGRIPQGVKTAIQPATAEADFEKIAVQVIRAAVPADGYQNVSGRDAKEIIHDNKDSDLSPEKLFAESIKNGGNPKEELFWQKFLLEAQYKISENGGADNPACGSLIKAALEAKDKLDTFQQQRTGVSV